MCLGNHQERSITFPTYVSHIYQNIIISYFFEIGMLNRWPFSQFPSKDYVLMSWEGSGRQRCNQESRNQNSCNGVNRDSGDQSIF